MTGLVFAILLALNFLLFPCEGKIILPDAGDTSVGLPGGNVTIAWKIDPRIPVSDLIIRQWKFLPTGQTLADIVANGNVTIKNTTFAAWIEIIKPSTLVLKNVDKRFNGKYQFEIRYGAGFTQAESVVEVFVAVTPMVSVNCSTSITLDNGDYVACECKGEGGYPTADVTWYKGNEEIVTGKEKASLRLPNVDKDNNGTYRCEAKSGLEGAKNVTFIEFVVNYPSEKTSLNFTKNGNTSVTITCEADAHPAPTFEILLNEKLVISNKTYTIPYPVNASDVGCYKCVAVHRLGNKSTSCNYLSPDGPTTPTTSAPTTATAATTNATTTKVSSASSSPFTTMSTTDTHDPDPPCPWWCYLLIIIAVLVLLMIIAYVVYRYKQKRKDGYRSSCFRGNADVSPGASAGIPVNHYELDEGPAGGVDNAYDTVNNTGATGSKSKPPENTTPDVYAAVDKKSREGKPLYATLDSLALQADNSKKKRDEERAGQTEYASIDFAKIGKADQE